MNTHSASRTTNVRLGNLAFVALGFIVLLFLLLRAFTLPTQAANEPTAPDALASISGKVTDENGQPMVGITVTLYQFDDYSNYWSVSRAITTSVDGNYKAIALGAGVYRIQFYGVERGYETVYWGGSAIAENAKEVVIVGNPVAGIDMMLHPGAVLTGSVSILNEQMATSGSVSVWQQAGTEWLQATESPISTTGTYEIAGLPAGVYRLWAETHYVGKDYNRDALTGAYGGNDLESAQNITLTLGETKTNLDIVLGFAQSEGVIKGKVMAGNTPLAGIRVNLYDGYRIRDDFSDWTASVYTYTDSNGLFEIGGLSVGKYRVAFMDPSEVYATEFYDDARYPVDGEGIYLDQKQPIAELTAALVQAASISGTLRYATGEPVIDTSILLFWKKENGERSYEFFRTSTDAMGNYQFKALLPGSYWLMFYSPRFGYEYYGTTDGNRDNPYAAQAIPVEAGSKVTNIDQILGPDPKTYLPIITK